MLGIEDPSELNDITQRLTTLSDIKYDAYGGYTPGVKFLESLAVWLNGFEQPDRRTALDFVLKRLAYISEVEMDHLVSTVYKDFLRPQLIQMSAAESGQSPWSVKAIADSAEFKSLQRRTLILGMSDGSRLDKLRRASPLSTEQFYLVTVLDDEKADDMADKLKKALKEQNLPGAAEFSLVVVVDDFSGSGTTMLREDREKGWDGKLPKISKHLEHLKDRGLVAKDATVVVFLYLMTALARDQLTSRMLTAGYTAPGYRLQAAHVFEESFPLSAVSDAEFWALCDKYFRTEWENEHTRKAPDFPHGYGGSALPLVIHHNAPNNAPPILWKDESGESEPNDKGEWIGVFPRHERHHPGRP